MTKKEFILQKIKEACPELMEKTRGCMVVVAGNEEVILSVIREYYLDKTPPQNIYSITGYFARCFKDEDFEEVIGHPPQLNHLLKTISLNTILNIYLTMSGTFGIQGVLTCTMVNKYDLSKSVTENLENNAMVESLAELLGYTE